MGADTHTRSNAAIDRNHFHTFEIVTFCASQITISWPFRANENDQKYEQQINSTSLIHKFETV